MKKIFGIIIVLLLAAMPVQAQKQDAFYPSFADLVETLLPGVVNISTVRQQVTDETKLDIISSNSHIQDYFLQDEGGKTSLGSGFLIDSKGYIMTNHHVIDGADEIVVTLSDDRQFKAKVVGVDKMTDLALIKIEDEKAFPFVKLGDSDKLRVGDWILAIGNPFGLGGSVTAGIVSAKSRDIDAGAYDNFIQTDASINQGSSGGPMFNLQGEVVGINTAIFSSTGGSMGIGFAMPVNLSKFVVEQLISKGKVERGWIGVKVVSNTTDIILSDKQTFKGGVVVSSLGEKSPASEAGIEAGDIIIGFNGNDVKDAKSFSRVVAETVQGTSVILRVWRNNQIKDVPLKVALMPEVKTADIVETSAVAEEKPAGYIEDLGLVVELKNGVVTVTEVLADSDAAAKGLNIGDVIQKADGKEVATVEDLRSYAAYAKAAGGPPFELRVLSNGLPQVLLLKVGGND